MKWIIHDWNDDDALKILKNCRRAIRPDGRLLVVESVLKPFERTRPGRIMDLDHARDGSRWQGALGDRVRATANSGGLFAYPRHSNLRSFVDSREPAGVVVLEASAPNELAILPHL